MNYSKNKVMLATVLVLVLSLCFLSVASLFSPVQAAPWTKYTGEVTLGGELFVVDAWVIKDGGTYKMWYTHSRTDMDFSEMAGNLTTIISSNLINDFVDLDLQGLLDGMAEIADTPAKMDALWDFMTGTTTVIGYATSIDGIDWSVIDDEVLAGASGTLESVGMPCVINDGGTYKMWFTHSDTSLDKTGLQTILGNLDDGNPDVIRDALVALTDSTRSAIGYATSSDGGETWGSIQNGIFTGDGGGLWDSVATPCVIEDGGTYKMWFTNAETDITMTDIDAILADIINFGVADLLNILDNTSTVIGYTESDDGITGWSPASVALAGDGGVWDSVATPCVINNGSSYEMWFTYAETDITAIEIQLILDELKLMEGDILALWGSYDPGDLNPFLTNFTNLIDSNPNMDNIKALLANTGNKIGYVTSTDGIDWGSPTEALAGSGGPWGGVGAPCVVLDSGKYEMWFTKGIDGLTAQNLLDVLQGDTLPIGYATFGEDIELVTGWNFIGLPLTPSSPAIEDVLADIIADVAIVWYYDGATATWYYFIPDGPQNLTEMTGGKAYWIEMTAPNTLTIDIN